MFCFILCHLFLVEWKLHEGRQFMFLINYWIFLGHFFSYGVLNLPFSWYQCVQCTIMDWKENGSKYIKEGVKRMKNVFRYSEETSKRLWRMCLLLPLNFLLSFSFHPKAIVCLSNNNQSDITFICLSIPKSGSLKKYKVKVLLSLILMVFTHRRITATKWFLGKGKFVLCRDESPDGFSHF